jgi:hypothetical protein
VRCASVEAASSSGSTSGGTEQRSEFLRACQRAARGQRQMRHRRRWKPKPSPRCSAAVARAGRRGVRGAHVVLCHVHQLLPAMAGDNLRYRATECVKLDGIEQVPNGHASSHSSY